MSSAAGWLLGRRADRAMKAGAMEPARVLVVELDAHVATRITRALESAGYAVRWEWSSLVALGVVAEWSPALVVLDWQQPFIDGEMFAAALQVGLERPPPVIALVEDDTISITQVGVAAVLSKPVDLSELVAAVGRILSPPSVGSI
jgi:DNA-binding response OmpR family regulator